MNKTWIVATLLIIVVTACAQTTPTGKAIADDRQASSDQTGTQATGQAVAQQKTKIGIILPLSGDLSITGEKINRGVMIAVDELSKDRYDIVFEDSGSQTTGAVSAASKLLNVDDVDVIIGTYSPDETLAIAPLAAEKGVQVFSFSFCSDSFKAHANVFCAYPGAAKQLETAMPLIEEKRIEKMALVDSNTDFGLSSRAAMKAQSARYGYDIVIDELTNNGERDYRTIVAKVKASGADAVFSATDDPMDSLTLMKQLHEAGYEGTRITFVDVDNNYLKKIGPSADGTYAPGIAPSSFAAAFTQTYRTKYAAQPDYPSALGYDVVRAVTGTIEENGQSTSDLDEKVITHEYADPAIDGFQYLPDHTVTYALELWTARDGVYTKA
jgi:ABC-type branched-subunit amino acid transport system substrate-binding protein